MPNSITPMNGNCNLPEAFKGLAAYPQFILFWRVWDDARGSYTKLPASPISGEVCDAHDSTQWASYDAAYAACIAHGASGVGFVFTEADPFWFLDIDHCLVNGAWSELAARLTAELSGAAVEISGGGDGLHIIGTGTIPPHSSRNTQEGMEFYSSGRFCALTFTHAAGDVMADKSEQVTALINRYFPPVDKTGHIDWTDTPVAEWAGPDDDDELIAKALRSKGGPGAQLGTSPTFKHLWEGDEDFLSRWSPGTNHPWDQSSADLELASQLSFWTGRNCERVERLMRRSALLRDKWDARPDWLQDTIRMGCARPGVYSAGKKQIAIPPPPRSGHATDDLGHQAGILDKGNHLYVESQVRGMAESLQYDEFADVILLNGEPMTDHTERELWFDVCAATALKINKIFFGDVIRHMAYKNRYHPVREYLDAAQPQWDGIGRCGSWLIEAAGAEDTAFNRAISRIFLIAAVRRVREPGCKYDELLILEGIQGLLKSTMLAALVPNPKWFTDCLTLGMDIKQVMEALRGVWIAEMPELSHMGKSEVEHVKSLLSRQKDRARPAYGRNVEDIPRQCVFAGTTNGENYLRDSTGNRRFWPVLLTRHADIDWLIDNRDQLWAEAAVLEAAGESIRLPESLWGDAGEQQALRMMDDPFAEVLGDKLGDLTGRIDSALVWALLAVPIERRPGQQIKMGDAMKRNGWERRLFREGERRVWKYWRGAFDPEITSETIHALSQGSLADVVPLSKEKEA